MALLEFGSAKKPVRWRIEARGGTLGRDHSCDLSLAHADLALRHAEIRPELGRMRVRALEGTVRDIAGLLTLTFISGSFSSNCGNSYRTFSTFTNTMFSPL